MVGEDGCGGEAAGGVFGLLPRFFLNGLVTMVLTFRRIFFSIVLNFANLNITI